jgi:hypothetical protein
MDKEIQVNQVADHAGSRINPPRHRNLDEIIMAVAMWIVALTVNRLVLCGRHFIAMQPVRS